MLKIETVSDLLFETIAPLPLLRQEENDPLQAQCLELYLKRNEEVISML